MQGAENKALETETYKHVVKKFKVNGLLRASCVDYILPASLLASITIRLVIKAAI